MPRYAEVEGLGRLEFPDDTPDAVMDLRVRREVEKQRQAALAAAAKRDAEDRVGWRPEWGPAEVSPTGELQAKSGPIPGARMILPGLGAIAGSKGGPAGIAMGAAAGEGVNQLISRLMVPPEQRPPVTQNLASMGKEGALTYGFGKAAQVLGPPLGKALAKVWPGHGYVEQEMAAEAGKRLPKAIKTKPAGPMFRAIERDIEQGGAAQVPLPLTLAKASQMQEDVRALVGVLRNLKEEKLAASVEALVGVPGERGFLARMVPMNEIMANMPRLGRLTATISDPQAQGAARALYKAMRLDLKRASIAGVPQAEALLKAQREYARNLAQRDVGDLVKGATSYVPGDARQIFFNPGEIVKRIKAPEGANAQWVAERLNRVATPEEKAALLQELDRLSQYAKLPAQQRFAWARRFPAMLIGGGLATAAGGGAEAAAMGGLAGMGAEEALLYFANSRLGRRLLQRLLVQTPVSGKAASLVGALLGEQNLGIGERAP